MENIMEMMRMNPVPIKNADAAGGLPNKRANQPSSKNPMTAAGNVPISNPTAKRVSGSASDL